MPRLRYRGRPNLTWIPREPFYKTQDELTSAEKEEEKVARRIPGSDGERDRESARARERERERERERVCEKRERER